MEIERKCLVKSLPPGWNGSAGMQIRQGYLPLQEENPLARPCFKALWRVKDRTVSKRRCKIPCRAWKTKLDFCKGRPRGLLSAEVELLLNAPIKSYRPPRWLGREITGGWRYANQSLARRRSR